MLAAVDLDEPGRARKVLETATALSEASGSVRTRAQVHVVHGWSLVGESILTCPVRGISTHRLDALLSRSAREHRERLKRLCAEALPREADGIHVHRGDPRNVIPAVVRRLDADVLVLGGADDSGLGRLLLGSTARYVIDRVACDVVTVRGRYRW